MKALTKNLIYFAIIFLTGVVIFRFGLSFFIEKRSFNLVWVIAGIYFIFNYIIGWFFGKKDNESLPLYDVGFRFHLVAYLLFNSVSLLWFILEFQTQIEKIGINYTTALIWGIFLLTHFIIYLYAQKQSIKGINKEELFE
ncbi:MAG: hypothetical protein ACLFQA_04505 [Bacteroidales bacterium]